MEPHIRLLDDNVGGHRGPSHDILVAGSDRHGAEFKGSFHWHRLDGMRGGTPLTSTPKNPGEFGEPAFGSAGQGVVDRAALERCEAGVVSGKRVPDLGDGQLVFGTPEYPEDPFRGGSEAVQLRVGGLVVDVELADLLVERRAEVIRIVGPNPASEPDRRFGYLVTLRSSSSVTVVAPVAASVWRLTTTPEISKRPRPQVRRRTSVWLRILRPSCSNGG